MSKDKVIGVVGLGAMGLGIAQVFAQAGFAVRATDANTGARETAHERLRASLAPRIAAGKMTVEGQAAALGALQIVETPAKIGAADMIVEAILEDMGAKKALWAELEPMAGPTCIFATNTSALSVAAMSEGLRHPERLLGLHFFNPAPVMKLVELVGHHGTSQAALAVARRLTEAAGKTVISSPDRPGFIVNRCARPFYGEALAMLEEGRSASDVDASMLAAGYRMGPFSLIDLIGADINLAATEGLAAAMEDHPRYHVFDGLRTQVANGDLGRKTGEGFLFPAKPGAAPHDATAIAARIEATLINEAASLVAEAGSNPGDVDTAMRLGLNFPRGPFEALAAYGARAVEDTLMALENHAPAHLKGRYRPAANLKELI